MKISKVFGRQILDSRGIPTIEAEVWLESGVYGRAAVPSGASTGIHEAHELRDAAKAFQGKGVLKAINNIDVEISDLLKGNMADDQYLIDHKLVELDGTDNKSRLGANAILAVSLAVAHAAANNRKVHLYQHINDVAHNPVMSIPMPMMNVLNGGKHASNSSDFQEFMIMPISASSYTMAVQIGCEIFYELKKIISDKHGTTAVGDEGGFTYNVKQNPEMLDLLINASEKAGYKPGIDICFALDVAASEFYKNGKYHLGTEGAELASGEMIHYLSYLKSKYPIISIEDGLSQDEWEAWQELTIEIGDIQLVGDDLFVTNPERLQRGITEKSANAILIKPNQIGTLTETIRAIQLAKNNGWNTIISHRSGETEDVTITHIAVGTGANQIKTGSLSRSERTAKHNELMRIESINSSISFTDIFSKS